MAPWSSATSRQAAQSSSSKLSSYPGFDDLSLDDADRDETSALGPIDDSWMTRAARAAETPLAPQDTKTDPLLSSAPSDESRPSGNVGPAAATLNRDRGGDGIKPVRPSASSAAGPSRQFVTELKADLGEGSVPIVLGVAVVDFNHLIGPTVEFAHPANLDAAIQDDEELQRLLPFLALPDGAHLSEEDYSYFHCVYQSSNPEPNSTPPSTVPSGTTLFGISCNRQLASSDLINRPSDVTRSMVQKAVVVIASQPMFGPIRDKLGVVTRAFFAQRDFSQTQILEDFYASLEDGLRGKASESAIYMGTSLRELVHKFRHRTLVMLKMLMLQKRIMLFGYPVEMLCTYQYSLVSLVPGLLLSLRDAGRADIYTKSTQDRPTSLKSSDRSSLMRYMGLPLQLFGEGAFFQPYFPLQQMDDLAAESWLIGTTNQIVTQQKECKYDLMVNIETMAFEFSDPRIERMVALTPADRKWMDDVVRTVEESWEVPDGHRSSYRGSDDDLRNRFEEYICAVLASLKYADFLSKSKAADISITGIGGSGNVLEPFSEPWCTALRATQAGKVWDSCTDPVLFDICEPRHPCEGKVSVVSDIGLRLSEGLHDLKIDQSLGAGREAISSAFAVGSSTLLKAFDGVRSEFGRQMAHRDPAAPGTADSYADSPSQTGRRPLQTASSVTTTASSNGTSPVIGSGNPAAAQTPPLGAGGGPQMADIKAALGGIGSGISGFGSFLGSRVANFRSGTGAPAVPVTGGLQPSAPAGGQEAKGLRPMSLSPSNSGRDLKG